MNHCLHIIGLLVPMTMSIKQLKEKIDEHLKKLNDDYAVERSAALKEIFVDVLPVKTFYEQYVTYQ